MVPQVTARDERTIGTEHPAHRPRIMIVAGEASGDMHGADLAAQILERAPQSEIFGIAGEKMRAVGVRALINVEEVAGMGATELASNFASVARAFRLLRRALHSERPDLVILIDFADFNMKFAWFARRAGVPVLYYILPQVWAWRRWRVRTLIERADKMAIVFPFEADLYARAGTRATLVGHPLLDRISPTQDRTATLARYNLPPRARLLAILPGSRRAEIRYVLNPMLDAAQTLCSDHDLVPVVALAPTLTMTDLRAVAGTRLDSVRIIAGDSYSIIAASEIALVASGTATLETALLGCPMVIAYKMSAFTYALGRILVRGVDFIGMPNILAGRRLVPELIQWQVTASNLVRAAEPMLAPSLHDEVAGSLRSLRSKLGSPGAASRVAAMALEMIA